MYVLHVYLRRPFLHTTASILITSLFNPLQKAKAQMDKRLFSEQELSKKKRPNRKSSVSSSLSRSQSQSLKSEGSSLVPEHIVDAATQRLTLASIFFAIQAWKIYDILLIKADTYAASSAGGSGGDFLQLNNFTFVLKYAVVDGLFLWLLPVLNVPLLGFLPVFTLLLTVLINSLNFLLTSLNTVPFLSSVFVPVLNLLFRQRELTIVGNTVPSGNAVELSAHFKGRYTIQYLPESSVILNPFAFGGMCLEESSSSTFPSIIKVPVQFNTTSEVGFMQIEHVSPLNERRLLNYSKKDVKRLARGDFSRYLVYPNYITADERVFYAEVPVSAPGRYRISRVVDIDGLGIRSRNSEFVVGACPVAKLTYPGPEQSYRTHVCLGDDIALLDWRLPLISVSGVMPLTVEISLSLNGAKTTFNTTLQLPSQNNEGLAWLEAHTVIRNTVEQGLLQAQPKLTAGALRIHINSVIDGAGVSRLYNPASNDKEVDFLVQLKPTAAIKLLDPSPAVFLTNKRVKKLQIFAQMVTYPLLLTIEHEATEKTLLTNYTLRTAEDLRSGIEVSALGSYRIISGVDRYCACQIDSSAVLVTKPLPPTVQISEKPILDKCVGTIGYEFDLQFTGTGPFEAVYEVYKNISNIIKPFLSEHGLREHRKRSTSKNLKFQYLPVQEGNYKLVFKSIGDLNYEGIPVTGENNFSTYISRRSSYTFFKSTSSSHKIIRLCKDGTTQVPLFFEGNFPFSFEYEFVDNNGKSAFSKQIKNQFDELYSVDIPPFKKGGEYRLVVKKVSDKLGCPVAGLAHEQIRIMARDDIPKLAFAKPSKETIVEGESVLVLLLLKSSQSYTSGDQIVYSVIYANGVEENVTVDAGADLVFSKEGVYTLQSFTNNGCPGEVSHEPITVAYHARPQLELRPDTNRVLTHAKNSFHLSSLCQGSRSVLNVKLSGRKPFTVHYVIHFPHGKTKAAAIAIDNDELSIPLPSSRKGDYSLTFVAVTDNLYSKENLDRIGNILAQTVTYVILEAPNLDIEKKYLQVCESQVHRASLLSIPISLEGATPFNVRGQIIHELGTQNTFHFENVSGSSLNLAKAFISSAPDQALTVGEHLVTFDSISDSNGCEKTDLERLLKLSVTPIPSMTKSTSTNYCCVGDYISYDLTGIAPFQVFYYFNEKPRRAECGLKFVRLALKPGKLTISALQDSSAGLCLVNYTSSVESAALELNVYDLPSVEVSHGDNVVTNLHEGDQAEITFKFTGTPPFLVTYVRTLDHKKTKTRELVESKTISDIWDYIYTEQVHLEGTYEAIRVSDAYCEAKRDVSEILRGN